ncbi:MAG: HD-GYP domain-containing protein [Sporomusaceae bacterium]|nr:HD-GYP domain-containing protein [Sporomusaceae bacterium]
MIIPQFSLDDLHQIVDALTTALDAKNEYTSGHSYRVASLCQAVARQLCLPAAVEQALDIAAHLHDIGKIGIPDAVLLKPGKLTPAEFALIKSHPQIGFAIVNKVSSLAGVAKIILHHHERMDGQGYPEGLKGETIPLGARIIAVCDAFDAMTSSRSYRSPVSERQALTELWRCAGSQFDPAVVAAFSAAMQQPGVLPPPAD